MGQRGMPDRWGDTTQRQELSRFHVCAMTCQLCNVNAGAHNHSTKIGSASIHQSGRKVYIQQRA